jgi:hypothetical protein
MLLQRLGSSLQANVEVVLSRLGENITLLGTGFTYYWYTSAANGLLRSGSPLANVQVEKKISVDQVIKQYYKVLATQEDVSPSLAITRYRQIYGVCEASYRTEYFTNDHVGDRETTEHPESGYEHVDGRCRDTSSKTQPRIMWNEILTKLIAVQDYNMLQALDQHDDGFFFGDPAAWTFENI